MRKEDITRAAKQDSMTKAPPVETFSARMPAYTYTSLCPVPALRKPSGKGSHEEIVLPTKDMVDRRKPKEWECLNCHWDTTDDDGMINAVLHNYHGGFYEWNATAVWTCPVCGCKFETQESN